MFEAILIQILSTVFQKLFDSIFPDLHPVYSEIKWSLEINRKGLKVIYNQNKLKISLKDIQKVITDPQEIKVIKDFMKENSDTMIDLKTKGKEHKIVHCEKIKGKFHLTKRYTNVEFYEELFLKQKELEIEKVEWDSETLQQYPTLSEVSKGKVKVTTPLEPLKVIVKFKIKDKYIFEEAVNLYNYSQFEGTFSLKNRVTDDWFLFEMNLLDLEKGVGSIKYALNSDVLFDVKQLIRFNQLQRARATHNVIVEVFCKDSLESLLIAEILKESSIDVSVLKSEYEWLKEVQKIETLFKKKFKIPHQINRDDSESLEILGNLLKGNIIQSKSEGPLTITVSPSQNNKVYTGPIRNKKLGLVNEIKIKLFSEYIQVLRLIEFQNMSEIGSQHGVKKRTELENGNIKIIFVQRGEKRVRIKYMNPKSCNVEQAMRRFFKS